MNNPPGTDNNRRREQWTDCRQEEQWIDRHRAMMAPNSGESP